MPAETPLSVWKGNTFDPIFEFKSGTSPLDLAGSSLVFLASWDGGSLRKETGIDAGFVITDAAAGLAQLTLTPTESRTIPTGQVARYEIERRIAGVQKTLLYGKLIGFGWVNDD